MPATPRLPIGSRHGALRTAILPGLLPAACALLFAGWCGTFYLGASAAGAATAHAVLVLLGAVGLAVLIGREPEGGGAGGRLDPLELGAGGRLLVPALLTAVALAWWSSPVPRAGRVGLVLLPALLVAPALFARSWQAVGAGPVGTIRRRAVATGALSAAVAVVSAWALASWLLGPAARPAEPLGHHLLLATWVVTLLPLALVPLLPAGDRPEPAPGPAPGSAPGPAPGSGQAVGRALAAAAGVAGVIAVLATRSLGGGLALVAEALVALVLLRRVAGPAGGTVALRPPAVGRFVGRLTRGGLRARLGVGAAMVVVLAAVLVASWGDPSLHARRVYWRAGWEGILERPVTGYGPGSTAWTLAAFLRPVPGINPPGEMVGELHLVPLALAYELGLPGLALALALVLVFALRRVRALSPGGGVGAGPAADPVDPADLADLSLGVAGLTGLAGALVMGVATADWRITALPMALAVAAGATLAGCRRAGTGGSGPGRDPGEGSGRGSGGGGGRARAFGVAAGAVYLVVAGVVLVPLDRAHWAYERAEHPAQLRRAAELDPSFPLYRFQAVRSEWLAAPVQGGGAPARPQIAAASADEAQQAAEAARGVAALWLRAGAAAAAAGDSAVAAFGFETACGLDPLGAAAPFNLLAVRSPLYRPEALGARALAAEPRLGAARLWQGRPGLLDRSLAALAAADGIDPGWRQQAVAQIRAASRRAGALPGRADASVALVVDARPAASLSLHLFRRLPRRVELLPIPVDREAAEALSAIPPATVVPGTDPRLFPPTCTGPFAPQVLRKTLWKTW